MTPEFQEFAKVVKWMVDTLFPPSPFFFLLFALPLGIALGGWIIRLFQLSVGGEPQASGDKTKREPLGYFEPPLESDEFVGIGDDGEMMFASDKPKRGEE